VSDLVVDASVAVKWIVPEEHTTEARRLLTAGHTLLAPELLRIEVAAVCWKKVQRGELTAEEAQARFGTLAMAPLLLTSDATLADAALQLSLQTGWTVYDSLYLALAVAYDSRVVTADTRLQNALAGTPLAASVVHVTAPL
jgi:predicted nucleic acid-binding protein